MINSFKLAHHKNELFKILQKVSLSLGIIAFLICFALYFVHYGFDMGYENIKHINVYQPDAITFSGYSQTIYEYLAHKYKFIVFFLAIFLIAEFLGILLNNWRKLKVISHFICFYALGLILYQFRWIFAEKELRSQESFWHEPYDSLLRNCTFFDQISFFIVGALVFIQVAVVFQSYYEWKFKN